MSCSVHFTERRSTGSLWLAQEMIEDDRTGSLHDDFAAWLAGFEADVRNQIIAYANLLGEHGP